jgi:hypothetical protein
VRGLPQALVAPMRPRTDTHSVRGLTLIACALALVAAAPAGAGSASDNRAAAVKEADSLLAAAALPPGATALPAEPAGDGEVLGSSPVRSGWPQAIVKTAWFRSESATAEVLAFADAHPPTGAKLAFSGEVETRDGHRAEFHAYERPRVRHVLAQRWLVVSVTRLNDGAAAIRVDASATWLYPRPAALTITGARHVTINSGRHKIVITDPRRVRRIAAMFNRLDLQQPSIVPCPVDPVSPPHPRLTFRDRAGGNVVAYAHVRPTGCPRVDPVVRHRRYSGLDLSGSDGARLLALLEKLGAL